MVVGDHHADHASAPMSVDSACCRSNGDQTTYPADQLTFSPTGDGAAVFASGDWHKHYVYRSPATRASAS